MFHDLLLDLGQAFLAAAATAAAAAAHEVAPGIEKHAIPPPPAGLSRNVPGGGSDCGDDGGDDPNMRSARSSTGKAVVFHVTEYDVIRGRYPRTWEDHAGAHSGRRVTSQSIVVQVETSDKRR